MNRLKAVIIGSGLIAKLKHIPAFHKYREKVYLAAICDLDLEAARQTSAAGGIPSAYADVGEMLAREKPDASCAISGSGKRGCACIPAPTRRAKTTLDPWLDDPFPDYDTEPIVAFSAT